MSNYQPTGKTYELTTIGDIVKIVTPENIDMILTDLHSMLHTVNVINKVGEKVSTLSGEEFKRVEATEFTWIDDGEHNFNGIMLASPEDPTKAVPVDKELLAALEQFANED